MIEISIHWLKSVLTNKTFPISHFCAPTIWQEIPLACLTSTSDKLIVITGSYNIFTDPNHTNGYKAEKEINQLLHRSDLKFIWTDFIPNDVGGRGQRTYRDIFGLTCNTLEVENESASSFLMHGNKIYFHELQEYYLHFEMKNNLKIVKNGIFGIAEVINKQIAHPGT